MKREPGFYWVKMSRYGGWIIAEYVVTKMSQVWFAPRVEQPFTDHQLAEIDENILTRK